MRMSSLVCKCLIKLNVLADKHAAHRRAALAVRWMARAIGIWAKITFARYRVLFGVVVIEGVLSGED